MYVYAYKYIRTFIKGEQPGQNGAHKTYKKHGRSNTLQNVKNGAKTTHTLAQKSCYTIDRHRSMHERQLL